MREEYDRTKREATKLHNLHGTVVTDLRTSVNSRAYCVTELLERGLPLNNDISTSFAGKVYTTHRDLWCFHLAWIIWTIREGTGSLSSLRGNTN